MNSCPWRMGAPNVRQLASLELVEASAPFGLVEASCTSPAPAQGQQRAGRRGSARTSRRRATELVRAFEYGNASTDRLFVENNAWRSFRRRLDKGHFLRGRHCAARTLVNALACRLRNLNIVSADF